MTREENERLTRVGPGTPMGELLRRYWMPIAISSQITDRPIPKRLLGEDLIVFRTLEGEVGVVEEPCAHRRTSLRIGICEARGIRCAYHGWMFGVDGRVLDQPAEPRLNPNANIKAYPAQELGGLVFAYLGPQPAPLLPRYDLFVMENCLRDIGYRQLDFNWLQAMENSVDPVHAEFLHGKVTEVLRRRNGRSATYTKYFLATQAKHRFDRFEHGIIKRTMNEGETEEAEAWKVGHPLVFPFMVKIGGAGFRQFQIRVPVDDVTTNHIWYNAWTPDMDEIPAQDEIPCYPVMQYDVDDPRFLDDVISQDLLAWGEQGRIADRSRETLGSSDKGVVAYRRMLMEAMDRVQAGHDPFGTVRDPQQNTLIELPIERNKAGGKELDYVLAVLKTYSPQHSPMRDKLADLFSTYGSRS